MQYIAHTCKYLLTANMYGKVAWAEAGTVALLKVCRTDVDMWLEKINRIKDKMLIYMETQTLTLHIYIYRNMCQERKDWSKKSLDILYIGMRTSSTHRYSIFQQP